jgi:hypothetical protein
MFYQPKHKQVKEEKMQTPRTTPPRSLWSFREARTAGFVFGIYRLENWCMLSTLTRVS